MIQHWKLRGVPNSLVASIPNQHSWGQPGLTPGLPDLLVIAPHLPIAFLELKTAKGRLSPAQRAIHELLTGAGLKLAVSYGLEEALSLLEDWGVLGRATIHSP